jgi:ribonuclease BN (tRNA processing enzyme)
MRVTVIGCGDAFGSGGRFQSATMIESNGQNCLVDCGATTQTALNRAGIDPNTIGTIFLTHLHGDHFGGVPFFLLEAQWSRHRTLPLVIAGPPGTRQRLIQAVDIFYPGSIARTPWSFDWQIIEIEPDTGKVARFGTFEVTTATVIHASGAPSTAVRVVTGGHVFAHSGDTQWTDTLYRVFDSADIAFVECHSYDMPIPMHIDYATLVDKRAAITARRLVLTHLGPAMLEHENDVDRMLFDVAADGQVFTV